MLNPNKKIAESKGIDIPILYVYLAGRIAGNCIDKCLDWRHKIVNHYANYKLVDTGEDILCPKCKGDGCDNCEKCGTVLESEFNSYPISFLDALNSKESDSVDKQGLTSAIPPNLIYDKDLMSVEKADVVVANMEDYMEEDIEDILDMENHNYFLGRYLNEDLSKEELLFRLNSVQDGIVKLIDTIKNRRPNYGTNSEVAWALYLNKPLILIAGDEKRKHILEHHPFMKRASVIVLSVDELLEKKWLNILYKSISGATYE